MHCPDDGVYMTVEARIRVHHRGCVSERTGGGTSISQLSADGHNSIFIATGDSPEDVDAMLAALEHALGDYSLVCRSPQVAMARGACPPSGVEERILAYGCSIIWPALFCEGREFFTIVAPSRDRLKHLMERLQEFGGATLESITDVRAESLSVTVSLGEVVGALTRKQLDVLTSAVKTGYYASPRQTSTEHLASAFGVSRATVEEHLRKAESKILQGFMSVMGSHPLLASAVQPGPTRRAPATAPAPEPVPEA